MGKFVIQPHFRLQEWVAQEKGYFKDEGLDYIFQEEVLKTDGKIHDQGEKKGAYQSFEKGRTSDISCACHWTVGVAASTGHGKLYPRRLLGFAGRRVRAGGFAGQKAGGPRWRADLGRLPIRQPLRDHPGTRAIHAG